MQEIDMSAILEADNVKEEQEAMKRGTARLSIIKENKLQNIKLNSDWCKCGKTDTNGEFADDGKCTCGIYKHHYHCGNCGNVWQVG